VIGKLALSKNYQVVANLVQEAGENITKASDSSLYHSEWSSLYFNMKTLQAVHHHGFQVLPALTIVLLQKLITSLCRHCSNIRSLIKILNDFHLREQFPDEVQNSIVTPPSSMTEKALNLYRGIYRS
jgi:hypothetical protein